jgi:cytochrome c biogenesis protein CcmG/thiol:disulfide interchange protein DsbE
VSTISTTTTSPRSDARARCEPLLGVIAGVIVVGLVALVVTLLHDETVTATPFDTAMAAVEGSALGTLDEPARSPEVGDVAPAVRGTDPDGNALVAPATGRPTVLLFLAHWCPHCQSEVPVVQDWIDDGGLPKSVDLVGIVTATRANRPNYPPSAWLEREGWTVPTISDAGGVAGVAYGASNFPLWVALDAEGVVVDRRTGGLTAAEMTRLAVVAAG